MEQSPLNVNSPSIDSFANEAFGRRYIDIVMRVVKTNEFWLNLLYIVVIVLIVAGVGMFAYKKWKQYKLRLPQPIVPEQPRMNEHTVKPQQIEQTNELEPVVGISDDDMRSLCAHIKKDKNATDEIVTSSDFSELLNAEQACDFAKHQYVDMQPMPRGTGKAVPNEDGVMLSEL